MDMASAKSENKMPASLPLRFLVVSEHEPIITNEHSFFISFEKETWTCEYAVFVPSPFTHATGKGSLQEWNGNKTAMLPINPNFAARINWCFDATIYPIFSK